MTEKLDLNLIAPEYYNMAADIDLPQKKLYYGKTKAV